MTLFTEGEVRFVEMNCRSVAEVMESASKVRSKLLKFPVLSHKKDREGNLVPCLGVRMMSDAKWNELTKRQAIKNYLRENGVMPESEEIAVEWQRQWVREILES